MNETVKKAVQTLVHHEVNGHLHHGSLKGGERKRQKGYLKK